MEDAASNAGDRSRRGTAPGSGNSVMSRKQSLALLLSALIGTIVLFGAAFGSADTLERPVCARGAVAKGDCPPRLEVAVNGSVVPKQLPARRDAPIHLLLGSVIAMSDGSQPPALREATFDFDRNGAIDVSGMPRCNLPQLKIKTLARARLVCRRAILGEGTVNIDLRGRVLNDVPMALFNAGEKGGNTTLYLLSADPTGGAGGLLARVGVASAGHGPYDLRAHLQIPAIDGGSGSLLGFHLNIGRLSSSSSKAGFASARCPDGHVALRMSAVFATKERTASVVSRPC